MPQAKLALSFRMFQNDQLIREETLTQGIVKIGKVPSAHLQIADEGVSRMHAIVEVTGREVHLIDLGSSRGTFVNGKKINKARLETGDVITLGDTRIEFAVTDAAPAPSNDATAPAAERAAPQAPSAAPAAPPLFSSTAPPPLPPAGRRTAATTPTLPGAAIAPMATAASSASAASAATGATAAQVAAMESGATVSGVIDTAPRTVPEPRRTASAIAAPAAPAPAFSAPAFHAPASSAPAIPAPRGALPLDTAANPVGLARVLAETAEEPGGARAVEVAAMLGDSVVGVKHCIDPRSGKVTPATWAVLAGGAACLLASAIAFAVSVSNAADNRARLETWTRVEHRPDYAFRPRELGPGVDWLAFGGFGLALVGLSLGIVRLRSERVSPYFRIGTAPGVELALDGAPTPAFPLIAPSGDDFVFNYAPGIDGELLVDGTATPLAALAADGRSRPSRATAGAIEVPIPPRARIRARAGQATFLVAAVPRPRRHVVPLLAGLERRALAYVGGSLAIHLGIWAILQALPPESSGVSINLPSGEPIAARLQGTTPENPVPERTDTGGDTGAPSAAAPVVQPPGAAGKPDATQHGHLQVARADIPAQLNRSDEIERARSAGPLGTIAASLGGPTIDGLPPGRSSGIDLESFNGPLYGGDGEGPGRFGNTLTDLGGGATCAHPPCNDTYSAGGYTIPSGPPKSFRPWGIPGRPPGLPGRVPNPPRIGEPTTGPGYDKTIVRRYIRHSIDKIGYCYDKQLLAHPNIGGMITVTFFIAPTGGVQSSSGTGFDTEVAGCVAEVVKAIAFPKPGDGIGVQVTYPFHFHTAGTT